MGGAVRLVNLILILHSLELNGRGGKLGLELNALFTVGSKMLRSVRKSNVENIAGAY